MLDFCEGDGSESVDNGAGLLGEAWEDLFLVEDGVVRERSQSLIVRSNDPEAIHGW